jgi:shikimate dehydrogenase
MQNAAFEAAHRQDSYEAVDVLPNRLAAYVEMLRGGVYLGANITIPYKRDVAPMMDDLDHDARVIGAVNTIAIHDGKLVGHNTDIAGAWGGLLGPVRDSLLAANVLLLGAGGSARALIMALTRSGQSRPREVVVAARRAEAGAEAMAVAGEVGLRARRVLWSDLTAEVSKAGVIINCTPLGLDGKSDPIEGLPVNGKVVLDAVYRPGGTPLFKRAWREGATALQGDEMLIHQGARSFAIWTGLEPPVAVMREALHRVLKK